MDESRRNFLLRIVKSYYKQGDNYFAFKSKKDKWHFGYTNDYPLQHGKGETFIIDEGILTAIFRESGKEKTTEDAIEYLNDYIDETNWTGASESKVNEEKQWFAHHLVQFANK